MTRKEELDLANIIVMDNSKDAVPTRHVICSNCNGHFVLAYVFINNCPACGIAFERDESGIPKIKLRGDAKVDDEELSGYHNTLKNRGELKVPTTGSGEHEVV